MWVRNSSAYPDAEVRQLVKEAVARIDMRWVCVNVKGGSFCRGMAYSGVPDISNAPVTADYLITLRLPDPWQLLKVGQAYQWTRVTEEEAEAVDADPARGGRWPEAMVLRCWREGLVRLAAHEAKHIEQFREGLSVSEVAAEHFSARALRRYREARP